MTRSSRGRSHSHKTYSKKSGYKRSASSKRQSAADDAVVADEASGSSQDEQRREADDALAELEGKLKRGQSAYDRDKERLRNYLPSNKYTRGL